MPIQQTSYANARADLGSAVKEFYGGLSGFAAEKILPVKDVMKESAYMSVVVRENLKRADAKHANGSAYNRVNLITEDLQYTCKDYGLEGVLTDRDRSFYETDMDAEIETVQNVYTKIMLEQEVRIAAAIFNTTTFTGADLYTDVSSAPWDAAGSNAIGHILAASNKVRANTGVRPDCMVIGAVTLNNLLNNTAIKAKFPGAPLITYDMMVAALATIVGLQEVIVGSRIYDGAKEGQSFSGSDIWSDDYALIFKKSSQNMAEGGLGRILRWNSVNYNTVESYREEQVKGDVFRVCQYQDEKIFDAYFGHLLKVGS